MALHIDLGIVKLMVCKNNAVSYFILYKIEGKHWLLQRKDLVWK